jgi:hypothetical protein
MLAAEQQVVTAVQAEVVEVEVVLSKQTTILTLEAAMVGLVLLEYSTRLTRE